MFVRSVLRRPGTASDTLSLVVESPWRVEVGCVTRSLGCFFTEAGEFAPQALGKVVKAAVAPMVAEAGVGKAKTN